MQEFLRVLEQAGELHRVKAAVSPLLEISEIADRQSKCRAPFISPAAQKFDPMHSESGGKALLFENIDGCDFPLAINIFGSYRRMEMALGCDRSPRGFDSIADRIASLTRPKPPRSLGEMFGKARELLPLLRISPKLKRSGLCQEVVKLTSRAEVDLTRLPLIKCWPLDGDPAAVNAGMTAQQAGTAGGHGRYITFAGMHTIHFDDRSDPKPASHNIGMYRAQLIDQTHLVMHWHVHHDGAAHWRSWKGAGERRMPIAIAFGGEAVLPYAATAPLPPGMSELLMAGFLNGRGIPLVKCKTVPLRVPANSEIVIEGWVSTECGHIGYDPRSGESLGPGAVLEGPFGDHTGFYSLPDRYPIVEVTAITHRHNAIFPATIVGLPPQEDYYMGKATERIFLPLLRTIIHDIEDYHLPMFGCFHNCAFIKIKKAYPLQARRVMHAVWGAGQMSWTKYIIVVDDDVNVHDELAVLRRMFEVCNFARDIETVNGPLDILDHAASRLGAGGKMGFDATHKMRGEEVHGIPVNGHADDGELRDGNPWVLTNTDQPAFGKGRCIFMAIEKRHAGDGACAIERIWREHPEGADFIIAVDSTVDPHNWSDVMFHWCANTDPGRDMIGEGNAHFGRIAFDATRKMKGDERNGYPVRDYPPIIQMSDDIKRQVQARWREYAFA